MGSLTRGDDFTDQVGGAGPGGGGAIQLCPLWKGSSLLLSLPVWVTHGARSSVSLTGRGLPELGGEEEALIQG